MSTRSLVALLSLLAATVLWWATAPPDELTISGAVFFAEVDDELKTLAQTGDAIGSTAVRSADTLPGHDDVLALPDGSLLASAMDGWIWKTDPAARHAERWLDAPLMASGMRKDPRDPDRVYFCASLLHGEAYPADERVGLYAVQVAAKRVQPIVLEVPRSEERPDVPAVFAVGSPLPVTETRPLAFCNDLDVSRDGRRIYFSEPFAYEGASMGGGAYGEAIALGRNGRLWMHDLDSDTTRLIAHGFHFLDGVLLEDAPPGDRERSALITETTHFQIQRLTFDGPNAGTNEILWSDLPGMPDGLDRDANGLVWIGLLGLRSAATDWIHRNPWVKPLLLRLPKAWIPKGEATGVLALDARAQHPLFLALHDGRLVRDVSVAIPIGDQIYLASFDRNQHGLVSIPRPASLRRHP
ncbi:MAG: SMP-30/gluconolaconase/LRE-like region [bacterium]|nr:SMP-30/gluconolaconase/LRE-like region [bacterium]